MAKWLYTRLALSTSSVATHQPCAKLMTPLCIRRATLFADTRAGALSEAGDLMIPIQNGLISAEDLQADLFDLTRQTHPGRTSEDEITLFKSTGYALEDLVAARLVYQNVSGQN